MAVGLWPQGSPDDPDPSPLDAGIAWRLVDAVSEVAAPWDALVVLTDLCAAHPRTFADLCSDDDWFRRAVAVAGTSRPLGDLLARFPDALRALERPSRIDASQIAQVVELAVSQATDDAARAAGVATIRRHVTAAIAGRDLTGMAGVEEVAADLAALAEGVLSGTLAALHRAHAGDAPAARIGVIGMGKLGGYELNYVSDVDVMFVHGPVGDGPQAEVAAGAEADQVIQDMLRLLNASTTMGRAYEVDPTLRPEGRHGALSRTVGSFVAYWEKWARTWEFQALLKARPVAGDRALGAELLEAAAQFVWPDDLDPGVVAEIRSMKARVEAKPEVRRDGERQVKLGPGGLRDIEFAVQLLQLVHGRHDRRLRITGTLPALTALATGGYIADEDAGVFSDAYRKLRQIEHHLQLANERRTHTIPADDAKQEWLARSLGYRSDGQRPARDAFLRDLRQVQRQVRELHAKLFYRPLMERFAAVSAAQGQLALPGQVRRMGQDAAVDRLRALGFSDATAALRIVAALTQGVSRRARAMRAVLPMFLNLLADGPDPDAGLRALERVLDAQGAGSVLPATLRDHPPAAELLARVLASSTVATELLAAVPQSLAWLADESLHSNARDRDELVRLAEGRAAWQDRGAALRRFKRAELARIVFRDLGGWSTVGIVGAELTALGEACLDVGLRHVIADVVAAEGIEAPRARLAIVGMGKFGGAELHYCSDLDVMFVHEAVDGVEPADAARFATLVAERVIRTLGAITAEGTAFEVDADLRPEGRNGALSRSLDAYATYYVRWSQAWEHQALLRARVVAGDRELGRRFSELAAPLAAPAVLDDAALSMMRRLKVRTEQERIPNRSDPKRHLKLGPGGLADIEWTVQLLQQRHGHDHPSVVVPGTMAALDALQDVELMSTRDATWLRDGYRHHTRVRNALYLLGVRAVDELPRPGPDGIGRLARVLGYGRGEWQSLEEDHMRATRHVRAVTNRLFYGVET